MQTVFEKFGGIRPMATEVSESPSTVQSWKNAGRIPAGKQPTVLARATALGLDVSAEDVIFPLGRAPDVVLCGGCDRRAEDPAIISCSRPDCPMRRKEAA